MRTTVKNVLTRGAIAAAVAGGAVFAAAAPAAAEKSCPDNVLDGCYAKAEMADYAQVAVDFMEEYMTALAQDGVHYPAPDVVFVPSGRTADSGCGAVDDWAYLYCPADQSVYLGQEQMWQFYHHIGAVSPVVGLAHEYGHHMQLIADVPEPESATENIPLENQADCIAGAWTTFAAEQGYLDYERDLANVGMLLEAIASTESPDRDHGTVDERINSFNVGYSYGLGACNGYVPGAPLVD